ncbi:class I tRNA ligase family protein, partial [Paenibacillus sepulcri]|nr:class I tRNA ligase family protein [Paenibacillus sepulcri]
PYAPILAEDIYGNLGGSTESVHLADYPKADDSAIDETLERDMETARQIVELARNVRNETGIKTRQPLSELIIALDREFDLTAYEDIIKDEINIKTIAIASGDSGFVDFTFKLNLKVAGKKYGKLVGGIQAYLKQLTPEQTQAVVQSGELVYPSSEGETLIIALDELLVEKQAKAGFASASGYQLTVAVNTDITPELEQEGLVREVIRAVQDTRKKLDLPIEKRVHLTLDVDGELTAALKAFESVLMENVLLSGVDYGSSEGMERLKLGEKEIGILIGG